MGTSKGPEPIHSGSGPEPEAPVERAAEGCRGASRERPRAPETGELERGSATAEFAVIMPCITVHLAVLLGAGACGATAVRAEEAARLAARSAARGDARQEAARVAREVVGPEARVMVGEHDRTATVTVTVNAPGIVGSWGGLEITADASARIERGSGPADPGAVDRREGSS